MKTVYLALGLMMTVPAIAASSQGSISVSLTITTRCSVDGQGLSTGSTPDIACGQQRDAQPKVTQAVVTPGSATQSEQRVVTVEW